MYPLFVVQDMASFKIAALQKALEESVPQADLDKVNKEYHQLTEKYRDLLEKGNTLVSKAEAITGLEVHLFSPISILICMKIFSTFIFKFFEAGVVMISIQLYYTLELSFYGLGLYGFQCIYLYLCSDFKKNI